MKQMKIGLLASHPIQYQAPLFRALAEHVEIRVFFAHVPSQQEQGTGFGVAFEWDVDLRSGYQNEVLPNVSPRPGVAHFSGLDVPMLQSRIREEKFDGFVVMGWHLKCYWQAICACRSLGVPVMVRGDSQLATPRSWLKRILKQPVYRLLLKQFDAYLTVGQRNRAYLLHYGAKASRLFFAPHFVDNLWFAERAAASLPNRETLRRSWGVSSQRDKVVMFSGKLQPYKRPLDILKAVAADPELLGECVVVFVGAGELEALVRATAMSLGVRHFFAGFQNQSALPAHYAAADVLVLPSDGRETWGLVVNEAMACGCPAVVSESVGCTPDLIINGETGACYPMGDVAACAEALCTVLHSAKTRLAWSKATQNHIQAYSPQNAASGTLDAVRSFVQKEIA